MHKQIEKPEINNSKVAAYSVTQKKNHAKQDFGILDNRQGSLLQRRLIEKINEGKQDFSDRNSCLAQRKIKTNEVSNNGKLVHLNANGFRDEFSGGDPAGEYGYNGVEQYMATYKINDDPAKETPVLSNNYLAAHAGHMLANQNGGHGDADNVFAQDGGVNTTNVWPSFEHSMRKDLNSAPQDADVDFNMYLSGGNISKGKLDRDHMPKLDFTKDQKKFFGLI